ncbi:2'-5' RNA ligase family protein [Streptomyces violaceorubidus]
MGTVTVAGAVDRGPEALHGSKLQQLRAGFGDAAAHGIPTHVTLLPPTEVDGGALPAIEAHLAEVAARGRPFPMRLSGTGTFRPLAPSPTSRRSRAQAACAWLRKRCATPPAGRTRPAVSR